MINIVDEQIESIDTLLQALFNPIPLCGFDDSRYDIEGENFFCGGAIAIDVKGNTVLQQQAFSGRLSGKQLAVGQRLDALFEQSGARTWNAVGDKHLIVKVIGGVSGELHRYQRTF